MTAAVTTDSDDDLPDLLTRGDDDDDDDQDMEQPRSSPPLLSAHLVTEGNNKADEEADTAHIRETIRQDVLREVAETEAELVDVMDSNKGRNDHRRRSCWIAICMLLVALIVGLSVGLTQRNKRNSSNNNAALASVPTESPTVAPTTDQCHVCYSENNNEAALLTQNVLESNGGNVWDQTFVYQTPVRTCQDVYEESLTLSMHDEGCAKLQADAAWKCGCPDFPPLLSNDRCAICPEYQIPVPKSPNDPVQTCTDAFTWLSIVSSPSSSSSSTDTAIPCDTLVRLAMNDCTCVAAYGEDNDENESSNDIVTGSCISTLDAIVTNELSLTSDKDQRTYVLCPNTSFKVGVANLAGFGSGNAIVDGQFPIVGRSNMRVQCGGFGYGEFDASTSSLSKNNCTIHDGSFGVFQSNGWSIKGSIMQDNIHIEGVTFVNVTNPVALYTPVNISVKDCIFDRFGGGAVLSLPFVLGAPPGGYPDSSNQRRLRSRNRHLQPDNNTIGGSSYRIDSNAYQGTISISDSVFRNGRIYGLDKPEKPHLIWLREPKKDTAPPDPSKPTPISLHMHNCLFDARGQDHWYTNAIYSLGGGFVDLQDNCFYGGEYVPPVHMNEVQGSHVIGVNNSDSDDFFFNNNFYVYDSENVTTMTSEGQEQHCAMNRLDSEEVCRAYFHNSSFEEVCQERWQDILSDDSTVIVSDHPLNQPIEYRDDCGTVERQQFDYRGTLNVTVSGIPCMVWTSTEGPQNDTKGPAEFPRAGLEGANNNFCRNPDGEPRAWCYTMDPDVRWEYCDVPFC